MSKLITRCLLLMAGVALVVMITFVLVFPSRKATRPQTLIESQVGEDSASGRVYGENRINAGTSSGTAHRTAAGKRGASALV